MRYRGLALLRTAVRTARNVVDPPFGTSSPAIVNPRAFTPSTTLCRKIVRCGPVISPFASNVLSMS